MTAFAAWSRAVQARMELALSRVLPSADLAPQRLHAAMRYATLGSGKRVRPMLALAAAEALGHSIDKAEAAACAVELIHVYSLTHDDLPCMDNDDLRRGKPTCHIEYDESTALLVGDALQTLAFEVLAESGASAPMIVALARAAGSRGMAGGQAVDLYSTGRQLELAELEFMHIHKTGALIQASVLLGAMAEGHLDDSNRQRLNHYARCLGLAFQVMDDVLDAETDTTTLGKTAGKDATQGKATYLTLMNAGEARAYAGELVEGAIASVLPFGPPANHLIDLAHFITERTY